MNSPLSSIIPWQGAVNEGQIDAVQTVSTDSIRDCAIEVKSKGGLKPRLCDSNKHCELAFIAGGIHADYRCWTHRFGRNSFLRIAWTEIFPRFNFL